jgi:hypothetical protein
MLLTGFDAKRLKKLYIGRVIKRHNLLQTLTRVNRTYKNFKYGYVVDFADIRAEFDATNKAYFDELQAEHGAEMDFSTLFLSKEEIEEEISEIKEILFHYDTENAELFSQQISQIQDRNIVLKIKKALGNAKSLYNLIRLFGHFDLLEKVDFKKLSQLYREAENHLALLNTKEALENNIDNTNLLNVALEDVLFHFTKISEEELVLADELKDTLRKTRETLASNFDKKDPEFERLKKMQPSEMTEMEYDYFKLKSREQPGRMSVDFVRLFLQGDSTQNVLLKNGDVLIIPKRKNFIQVAGQVLFPGNVKYHPTWKVKDYIRFAGGFNWNARKAESGLFGPKPANGLNPVRSTDWNQGTLFGFPKSPCGITGNCSAKSCWPLRRPPPFTWLFVTQWANRKKQYGRQTHD